MICNCNNYQHIELNRKDISDRIKDSKQLKKQLILIAKHPIGYKLYKCETCGQQWQGSFAWNWGNNEYLFKVPNISIDNWLIEPYMSPDEMLIYHTMMQNYCEKNNFKVSETKCREIHCSEMAVINNVFCKRHLIESLQSAGILPQKPLGRIFNPYHFNFSEQEKNKSY